MFDWDYLSTISLDKAILRYLKKAEVWEGYRFKRRIN